MNQTSYSGKLLQTFKLVTVKFVSEILQKTAPKSFDFEPISTKVLYENIDVLHPVITNIINTSLAIACNALVPDLKTAVVKPLLKNNKTKQNKQTNKHTNIQTKKPPLTKMF